MGRASKFSFPLPGRKATAAAAAEKSFEEIRSKSEWTFRRHEPSGSSKAERLLGFSEPSRKQPKSHTQSKDRSGSITSHDSKPSYMTVTMSEANYGDGYADGSLTAPEELIIPPRWQTLHPRASSNALGAAAHDDTGRSGSVASTRQIHNQGSSSTLRSYYDSKKSPLSISQQTSASAVRDMGLRKGQPAISPSMEYSDSISIDSRSRMHEESMDHAKRSKPARLDLSRLFPKPKTHESHNNSGLLEPGKLVSSPTQLSMMSEYYPRPPPLHQHIEKPKSAHSNKSSEKPSKSRKQVPPEKYQKDIYDNAKVNVRRPPRGIQHWFEGLGDTDEDEEEPDHRAPPPPVQGTSRYPAPGRKAPVGPVKSSQPEAPSKDLSQTSHFSLNTRKSDVYQSRRNTMMSQQSATSHATSTSTQTKESKFSGSNLQDYSVLSFSSSDEEDERQSRPILPPLRDSLATDTESEIIIGKAQAFDIHSRMQAARSGGRWRPPSEASIMSNATNAATIDVMLATSPRNSYLSVPRKTRSKRSTHRRQPSAIPEDEGRPTTANTTPEPARPSMSPTSTAPSNASVRSGRTSRSEPRLGSDQHKLMAVTEEEEALLEMMRRKRAAMAKHSFTEGYKTALKQEQQQTQRQNQTPTPLDVNPKPRTSGFLTMDSPSSEMMAAFPTPSSFFSLHSKDTSRSRSDTLTSSNSADNRGRRQSRQPSLLTTSSSIYRDASSSSTSEISNSRLYSDPDNIANTPYQLPPNLCFSPLDPFPPPLNTPTADSVNSPTTASHASPLPSPVTPGPRTGETYNVRVKVASSEPSTNGDGDEELNSFSSTGIVDPILSHSSEKKESRQVSPRTRRRTASSGAEVIVKIGETPRKQESLYQDGLYKEPKSVRAATHTRKRSVSETIRTNRTSAASSNATVVPQSARSSLAKEGGRRLSKSVSRGSRAPSVGTSDRSEYISITARPESIATSIGTRCSASDDVLAAWGSLGGWRDVGGNF